MLHVLRTAAFTQTRFETSSLRATHYSTNTRTHTHTRAYICRDIQAAATTSGHSFCSIETFLPTFGTSAFGIQLHIYKHTRSTIYLFIFVPIFSIAVLLLFMVRMAVNTWQNGASLLYYDMPGLAENERPGIKKKYRSTTETNDDEVKESKNHTKHQQQ